MEKELRAALNEVMEWIRAWDPNFIYDEEWPETKKRVEDVLARSEDF